MINVEEIVSEQKNQSELHSIKQQLDEMMQDPEFNEYLARLSNNKLIAELKEQIAIMSGEIPSKSYGKRKGIIIAALLAGAVISFIGSLTFLVGEQFPKEFSEFAEISVNDDAANKMGNFLGWTNVAIEAIFYTWTVYGVLPPLQPVPKNNKISKKISQNPGFIRRCFNKVVHYLLSVAEWGLAIFSTIPLTFLSLIDEEKKDESNFVRYGIVSSIALVTLVSNKYFLTATHQQFRKIWNWLFGEKREEEISQDLLMQLKKAFSTAIIRANERLPHLNKEEFNELIDSLKNAIQRRMDLENQVPDRRWENLLSIMLKDLSFPTTKISTRTVILVPAMAIFAALSWLGLIATVPNGVKEKISSSSFVQYLLMVIAGIPLIEIGLSAGGTVGLRLSRIGSGLDRLTANLVSWKIRLLGYIPLGLFGLFSFGTNATLTLQQFGSVPAITWMLLPSATLGINLINIFAGTELWDQISASLSTAFNRDKQLFIKYQAFLSSLVDKIESIPEESLAAFLLRINPEILVKIKQFVSSMQDHGAEEFIGSVSNQLHLGLLEKKKKPEIEVNQLQSQHNQAREKEINKGILFSWENVNQENSIEQVKRGNIELPRVAKLLSF